MAWTAQYAFAAAMMIALTEAASVCVQAASRTGCRSSGVPNGKSPRRAQSGGGPLRRGRSMRRGRLVPVEKYSLLRDFEVADIRRRAAETYESIKVRYQCCLIMGVDEVDTNAAALEELSKRGMISSERCVAMSAANHDSNWAKHKFKLLRARRVDQDRREQEQRRSASARARKGGCLAHDAAAPEGGEHVRAAVAVQQRAPSTETKTARAASAHARLQRPLAAAEAAAAAAAEASSLPDTPRASALETHVATPATSERCIPTWSSLTPEAAASVQSSSAGGRASSTSASSSASSPCSSLSAEGSSVQG